MGMLNRGNTGVSPDGIDPRHIPNGVRGSWEGSLQDVMSWTLVVVQEEVTLVNFSLRANLVLRLGV